MDLKQLRYFVAVAEQGHFSRAAQQLHIVQPALSMQIRALEEEIGGPVFARTSRRVELTEAGALLLVYRPIKEKEMTGDLLLLSRADETGGAVRAFLSFARRTP